MKLSICLTIVLLSLGVTQAVVRTFPTKNEYLNPSRVAQAKQVDSGGVQITCYEGLAYWVCPNPEDDYRARAIEEQYYMGMYISKKRVSISRADFDDETMWNS